MATLAVTHNFTALAKLPASWLQTNFSDVEAFVNTECIQRDGSVAATAHLSGPASLPTTLQQYANKDYVDRYSLKSYKTHVGTYLAQNNGAMVVLKDTNADLGTPNYNYRMFGRIHIMQKCSADGHQYYEVVFGAGVTNIMLEPNGSGSRHSAFTQAGKWESAGTLMFSTTQNAGVAARWRLRNQNNDVFGTADIRIIAETYLLPNPA